MFNIIGWVSFFFTSIVALASAFSEYKKHGFKPETIKYYFNLFVILTVCLGMAVYPFEKISDKREKDKLKNDIENINNKTAAIQKHSHETDIANEKIKIQNQLLKNQILLTNKNFKLFKNQISQFSVVFSAQFEIPSPTNISSGLFQSFLRIPHVAVSNEKNTNWIYFGSSPVNYDLSTPFEEFNQNPPVKFYSYNGVANVIDGIPPIGQNLEALKGLNVFTIYVPMHTRIVGDMYNSRNFRVNGCTFFFTLNGVDLSKHRINCPQGVFGRIGEFTEKKYKEDFLTIQFKLKNDLYELLALEKF